MSDADYQRAWYLKNRSRIKRQHEEARRAALHKLGGMCSTATCEIDDHRVLEIDHAFGDGHLETRGNYALYLAIIDASFDKVIRSGWQLLCANCHAIKTRREQDNLVRPAEPPEPDPQLSLWPTLVRVDP